MRSTSRTSNATGSRSRSDPFQCITTDPAISMPDRLHLHRKPFERFLSTSLLESSAVDGGSDCPSEECSCRWSRGPVWRGC